MIQVRTRGGVFGPGGYGGGIFDGSEGGFGGMGEVEQAAAGISGLGAGLGALTWMGTPGDPIVTGFQLSVNKELTRLGYKTIGTDGQLGPTTCGAWSWMGGQPDLVPDANIQAFEDAMGGDYSICKAYSNPIKLSTGKAWSTADMGIQQTSVSAPYVWGAADPRVIDLQHQINVQLVAMGYNPIEVTGKIDAATCGAMRFATAQWGIDFGPNFGANCQAYTDPTKAAVAENKVGACCHADGTPTGACPPGACPGEKTTPEVQKAGMTGWVVGGLLAAAVVAGVYATRKKR